MNDRDWLIHCLNMVAPQTAPINCVNFVNALDAYLGFKRQTSGVPPKRKPLDETTVFDLADQHMYEGGLRFGILEFARAIESRHGIES